MLNILVVDDSLVIRRTLKKILAELGHTVVGEAFDAKGAVFMYEKCNPDLVTMDITMPTKDGSFNTTMNGLDAIRLINLDYPDANFLMITSHGEEKKVMEAISLGAKGYILKPITAEKMKKSIDKIFPELKKKS